MPISENDDQQVMVGASFDEIRGEAAKAVQSEVDRQVQQVLPQLAQTITETTATLVQANRLIRRYRYTVIALALLAGIEGGFIISHFYLHH